MTNNPFPVIGYMLSAGLTANAQYGMATTMTTRNKSSYYFPLSAIIFLFYFSWAATLAMASQWLWHILHLDNTTKGMFFTANALGAMLLQPVYGAIQDRLGVSKKLLLWVGFVLTLCWPVMGYLFVYVMQNISPLLALVVSGGFIALGILAAAGVVDSYCERVGRNAGLEYGSVRVWGAVGWCIGILIAGRFTTEGLLVNLPYIACSAAGILLLLVLFRLNDKGAQTASVPGQEQQVASLTQSLVVLKEFRFWTFAIFLFGIAGLYFLFDQQFQDYYALFFDVPGAAVGAGGKAYSYLYACETIIEIVCLPLVPFVVNRIGARNSLILAAGLMGLRILCIGLLEDKWLITALYLTRGFEIPLLLVAVFKFMEGVYDPRFSSTIYLIAFQFAQQLCSICFATQVGRIITEYGATHQAHGFQIAYIALGVFGLFFMVWGAVMLPRATPFLKKSSRLMESVTPAAQ